MSWADAVDAATASEAPCITDAGGEGVLHCPVCGENYLHHGAVDVRIRRGEDNTGTHHHVDGHGHEATESPADDPGFAGRRDDVGIAFTCEQCPFEGDLRIVQHKGQTLLRWAVRVHR